MYFTGKITRREKVLIGIILILFVLWQVDTSPTKAAAPQHETILLDSALYNEAKKFAGRGEMAKAVAYLYAYIQRNPHRYKQNISGHADVVDRVFDNYVADIQNKIFLANKVNKERSRGEYPCPDPNTRSSMSPPSFPEDMVQVCVNSDYRGQCSYLSIGEYNSHSQLGVPNDSISSVKVGENVKVRLCVHNLAYAPGCFEFTRSDSNLDNNSFVQDKITYSLNDNISTAQVSYKDGIGFSLP